MKILINGQPFKPGRLDSIEVNQRVGRASFGLGPSLVMSDPDFGIGSLVTVSERHRRFWRWPFGWLGRLLPEVTSTIFIGKVIRLDSSGRVDLQDLMSYVEEHVIR